MPAHAQIHGGAGKLFVICQMAVIQRAKRPLPVRIHQRENALLVTIDGAVEGQFTEPELLFGRGEFATLETQLQCGQGGTVVARHKRE